MKKKLIYYSTIVILIFIDQITKIWMANRTNINLGLINLSYVKNTGMAFGIARNSIGIIIAITIAIIFLLLISEKRLNMEGTNLVLAGGISNLFDRVYRGFVIDFIDINRIIPFPIFNLADISIVIGIILMIISIFNQERKNEDI